MTQPAEKAQEFIAEINAMALHGAPEDRLESIERELVALEKAGCVYQAWLLQGMIAGLRGDANKVRERFQAALRASGNELIVSMNYARALSNVRHLREAVEQIDSTLDLAPDDVSVLELALSIHHDSHDVEGAEKIIERLTRLGKGDKIDPQLKGNLMYLKSEMEKSNVSWVDVSERIELATSVLESMGIFSGTIAESAVEDGLHLDFLIRGDMETAYRAESAIHNAIADRQYSSADRFVSFGCVLA